MTAYCTRADVNDVLAMGGILSPSAIAHQALASSDTITLDGHGLSTDSAFTMRAVDGGSLPDPLTENTTYYAIRLTNAAFKVAATVGGSALNLTTDGVSVIVIREPNYDKAIARYSEWAEQCMPGVQLPIPASDLVTQIVAELVAKKLFNAGGQASLTIDQLELSAKAQLERFAAGLPLRSAPTAIAANLAITGGSTGADPRGWGCPSRLP